MITLQQVNRAMERIGPFVVRTPCQQVGDTLFLKREDSQTSGSFKIRGVLNMVLEKLEVEVITGLIAHSSGNHGIAVAHASKQLNIPCKVLMPSNASVSKIEKCEAYGAEVQLLEGSLDQLGHIAQGMANDTRKVHIPPYDHESIIAGHATIALEILETRPDVKRIIVPCGGGALLAGMSCICDGLSPSTKAIGVEPILGNDVSLSMQAGHIIELPFSQTSLSIADGLRATKPGEIPFRYISAFASQVVCVTEFEIALALERAIDLIGMQIEPSGAIGLAVVENFASGGESVVVLTGSNL